MPSYKQGHSSSNKNFYGKARRVGTRIEGRNLNGKGDKRQNIRDFKSNQKIGK